MSASLLLVILVAVAYGAAKVAFQWLGRHFLIVSGAEYLLLGILLGPQVSGVLSEEALRAFTPFMTLSLGWMGAMVGMRLYLPALVRLRGVFYRVAFVQSLITLFVVTGSSVVVLQWLFNVSSAYALVPSLVLGAVATGSAADAMELIVRRQGRATLVVRQLEVAVWMDSLVAIVTLALVLCLSHVPAPQLVRSPTAVEWAVISVTIGVVGGALFHLFLGEERDQDRLFISLAGAIVLMTGAATYLRLSPLLPGLLLGTILVNTSRNRSEIVKALTSVERPLYFVLLLCGGAIWTPSTNAWVVPVVVFVVMRGLAKVGGARLAARFNGMLPILGNNWGRALLGQGGLALAIAFNYLTETNAFFPNIIFTAAIASVLLTDLFSARLMNAAVGASPHAIRASGSVVAPAGATAPAEPARPLEAQPAASPPREDAVASHEGKA
ncbi:MAG TPA: hypothetical protein VFT04_11080 [Gemmatimonadales bacterium]|nr:hypothetical protein [Gemmatimonadales bacterium]